MPPQSTAVLALQPDFGSTFVHQLEESTTRSSDLKKEQLSLPEWDDAHLFALNRPLESSTTTSSAFSKRLNVKTHVFKKEIQEYIPTQVEDRLRIETIIYVELSILDENGVLVKDFDYVRMPKELFLTQADKVLSDEQLLSKRILDVNAVLQCPTNGWQEETEACLRCSRRMSSKSEEAESRIMHMLPELHRTHSGDALMSFRNGLANIQFKINCYCGHKKEKEGFVIRFDSKSDSSIASHLTLPLMFYHQNKNRAASRALTKEQDQQDQGSNDSSPRNIVKSVSEKNKRQPRSKLGHSPIGYQHQIPSPPNSLLESPVQQWSASPEMSDFMDSSDLPFAIPSPPPPDPLISLFPTTDESTVSEQEQQQQHTIPLISHMTPSSGPVRGGTMVTIHGTGFVVGEVMYVCFGENLVPIIPQHHHMLECFTPASTKAETVAVFAVNNLQANVAQATFTYVDDNEKELIKLALQRMMNITARMNGPVDSVLNRANEFTMWSDLLTGAMDGTPSSSLNGNSFTNLEKMVLQSFKLVDESPAVQNSEGLSMVNNTGHSMLHLAVALQFEELAKELVRRGINAELVDKNGLTALALARHLKNQIMADILSDVSMAGLPPKNSLFTGASEVLTNKTDGDLMMVDKTGDVVAHDFKYLESIGSAHTGPDPQAAAGSHGGMSGGILGGIVGGRVPDPSPPTTQLTASHCRNPQPQDDHKMIAEWEGFGQGPGHESGSAIGSKAHLDRPAPNDQEMIVSQSAHTPGCPGVLMEGRTSFNPSPPRTIELVSFDVPGQIFGEKRRQGCSAGIQTTQEETGRIDDPNVGVPGGVRGASAIAAEEQASGHQEISLPHAQCQYIAPITLVEIPCDGVVMTGAEGVAGETFGVAGAILERNGLEPEHVDGAVGEEAVHLEDAAEQAVGQSSRDEDESEPQEVFLGGMRVRSLRTIGNCPRASPTSTAEPLSEQGEDEQDV